MEKTKTNIGRYIIAGAGKDGKYLCEALGENNVECFVDNDNHKIGKVFCGKKVISYKDLKDRGLSTVVISSLKYREEIKKLLNNYGVENVIGGNELLLRKVIKNHDSYKDKRRIILLNSHDGSNIGDMLISISELYFFKKYLPEYLVVEIPLSCCLGSIQALKDVVKDEDILVISGGGYMGSLWMEGGENNIRKYILSFPNNRIFVFPQTMYFENNDSGMLEMKKSKEIYDGHCNLTLCFRDKESYERGQELFSDTVYKYYVPDVVTLIDKSYDIYERQGMSFCLREDKEKIFDNTYILNTIEDIYEKEIRSQNISMILNNRPQLSERMDIINNMFAVIQKSEVVVTDRLHCMLACAVSGTPCIAFDNLSGKVKGTYRWIKNNKYICFFESLEEALKNKDVIKTLKPGIYIRNEEIKKTYAELANKIRFGRDDNGL